MLERLETIYKRYEEIKEELTKNEVISDLEKLKKLSKEQRDLEEVVTECLKYKEVVKQISEDKELLEDEELKEVAKEELASLEVQEAELLKKLEILLLPKDENDGKNVILEIRGAAGGDEANIFAGDLFRMYQKYAERQNWHIEVTSKEEGSSGGFSD